jgi:hypothetical protein
MEMIGGSEMEGIIFFWGGWLFWIHATFFINKKSPYRLKGTVCILLLLILVPFQLSFFGFQINTALLFLYMFSVFHVIQKNKLTCLYVFLSSFIIMLAYVSFLLFKLYDPAWVILNDHLMLGFVLVYLCVLLQSDKILRFYTIAIGAIQGELLFSLIIKHLSFSYPIGSLSFFDCLTVASLLLFLWSLLELAVVNFDYYLDQRGREKMKST